MVGPAECAGPLGGRGVRILQDLRCGSNTPHAPTRGAGGLKHPLRGNTARPHFLFDLAAFVSEPGGALDVDERAWPNPAWPNSCLGGAVAYFSTMVYKSYFHNFLRSS